MNILVVKGWVGNGGPFRQSLDQPGHLYTLEATTRGDDTGGETPATEAGEHLWAALTGELRAYNHRRPSRPTYQPRGQRVAPDA